MNAVDLKEYYKKLWNDVYAILKPHGFRRKGSNIYLVQENGIVKLIELQKSQFNRSDWSQFTMNVGLSLFDTPVPPDKLHYWFMHFRYHLGESLEDGWTHQFWYHVTFPKPYCWVENGIIRTPAFDMGPYLSMEDIHVSVCKLVTEKALPLWESVQTHADYLSLMNKSEGLAAPGISMEDLRRLARIYGRELLPYLEKSLMNMQEARKHWPSPMPESLMTEGEKRLQEENIANWEKRRKDLSDLAEELKKA